MADFVETFGELLDSVRGRSNAAYCGANSSEDQLGLQCRTALAKSVDVSPDNLWLTGSTLDFITLAPSIFGRREILRLATDFPGYGRGAFPHIRDIVIDVDPFATHIPAEPIVNALAGLYAPILFLTFPITNPWQQVTDIKIVRQVLAAHPDVIVVIDDAYRGGHNSQELLRTALSDKRVIYIQSCAKDLNLPGARVGYSIGTGYALTQIAKYCGPYQVGRVSVEQTLALVENPAIVTCTKEAQGRARDVTFEGLEALGVEVVTGYGPWLMARFGESAKTITEMLGAYNVRVQHQASARDWVRISGTTPCQAVKVVASCKSILDLIGLARNTVESVMDGRLASIERKLDEAVAKEKSDSALWAASFGDAPTDLSVPAKRSTGNVFKIRKSACKNR